MRVQIVYEDKNFEATIDEVTSLAPTVMSQIAKKAFDEISEHYVKEVRKYTETHYHNNERYNNLSREMVDKSSEIKKATQEASKKDSESEKKISKLVDEIRALIDNTHIAMLDISESSTQLEIASCAWKEFTELSSKALEFIPFESKAFTYGIYTFGPANGKKITLKLT